MTAVLSALLALVIVAMVVMVALMGWGGPLGRAGRIGLTMMAAGLLWAGPARFLGYAPGLGDVLFLGGIALYVGARHALAVWRRLDGLDGVFDGKIGRPG